MGGWSTPVTTGGPNACEALPVVWLAGSCLVYVKPNGRIERDLVGRAPQGNPRVRRRGLQCVKRVRCGRVL